MPTLNSSPGRLDPDQQPVSHRGSGAARWRARWKPRCSIDRRCRPGAGNAFRANGSTLVTPGSSRSTARADDVTSTTGRPPAAATEQGDRVALAEEPPGAAFHRTAAALIRKQARSRRSREYGIGRPSTTTRIIQTLLYKSAAVSRTVASVPTDLVDVRPTPSDRQLRALRGLRLPASMEDELDGIIARRTGLGRRAGSLLGRPQEEIDDVERKRHPFPTWRRWRAISVSTQVRLAGQRALRPPRRVRADRHSRRRREKFSSPA